MKKILITLSIVACFTASAERNLYGDGYLIVKEQVQNKSSDLQQVVYKQVRGKKRVIEALMTILKGTGWKLAKSPNNDPAVRSIYLQDYPDFKRELGPSSLESILNYIGGEGWALVVDPVHKLISYEVANKYRCQGKSCSK